MKSSPTGTKINPGSCTIPFASIVVPTIRETTNEISPRAIQISPLYLNKVFIIFILSLKEDSCKSKEACL